MNIVEEFWLPEPPRMREKLEKLASQSAGRIEVFDLCTSYGRRPVTAVRMGRGARRLLYTAGIHGYEGAGPYGSVAFVSAIATGRGPDDEELTGWAAEILKKQTIVLIPFLNVDGAAHFARFCPGGYFARVWFPGDQEAWNAAHEVADWKAPRVRKLFDEGKIEGPADCAKTNDQGIDLWTDWGEFHAPETRALRDFLADFRPQCLVDAHGQQTPSRVFAPTWAAPPEMALRQTRYAWELMHALRSAGLPCSRTARMTPWAARTSWVELEKMTDPTGFGRREEDVNAASNRYIEYTTRQGIFTLFWEINDGRWPPEAMWEKGYHAWPYDRDGAPLTQRQMIKVGYVLLKRLVQMGNELGYL